MPDTPSWTPFGRVLTAMATPMTPDGALDEGGVRALARHLVATGHDGIVVNGTTGESATLTDDESIEAIRLVVDEVGDEVSVVAGVGSNSTAHSLEMTERATEVGADSLLLVSPYYNKPTQAGLVAHCRAVADSTELPIMLYDIPGRTGIPFATETLVELAEHPRIQAVKDAKGDLARAREIHERLIPVVDAIMTTSQGAIMVKAALVELGIIDSAHVRLPLVEGPAEHLEILRAGLAASGVTA